MAASLLFWLALSLFWTHEVDAMYRKEWRMLPVLRDLPDDQGRAGFTWIHVPIFLLTAYALNAGPLSFVGLLVSGFCVIHVGLHWLFRKHPEYRFHGIASRIFIGGAGVCGALHVAVVIKG